MHSPTTAADSTRRASSPFSPGYHAAPGYATPGYAATLPNFSAPGPIMMRGGSRRSMLAGLCTFQAFLLMYLYFFSSAPCDKGKMIPKEGSQYVYDAENRAYQYDRNMPLIFIGGVPRSGTTLARVMLDAHPSIRCGEETRVIPRILAMQVQWRRSTKEKSRLEEAGVTDEVLDDAISSFVLEVIAKHGEAAPYLCNKDPFTHKSTVYLSSLFPNAKFILMLRDGRAAVHSMITRKVTITGFDLTSYRNSLTKWNQAIENMYSQCVQVGPTKCMPVQYEQLVLHPKEWMERILTFLEIPWDEAVLHHQDFIGKPGGASLSKIERSTDQVVKPVNLDALTSWVGHMPDDVVRDMPYIAPMLQRLGYDPRQNPPDYGKPDAVVLENTKKLKGQEYQYNPDALPVQVAIPGHPGDVNPPLGDAGEGKGQMEAPGVGENAQEQPQGEKRMDHVPVPPA
ncbi:protein-tyrosine sulfotransferase 1-like isoform X2 [Branchiostoma floridae]|uniref:Protein-tyrosine sulfotransferase n=2 Tax=Branchiostoma floridae TaxID=7739 RepID=A0A9J7LYC4_BRAFL|nr:protein-tyrosine sulfotransferase 1-like isoform X2 [Branchiostoma floridae]